MTFFIIFDPNPYYNNNRKYNIVPLLLPDFLKPLLL